LYHLTTMHSITDRRPDNIIKLNFLNFILKSWYSKHKHITKRLTDNLQQYLGVKHNTITYRFCLWKNKHK